MRGRTCAVALATSAMFAGTFVATAGPASADPARTAAASRPGPVSGAMLKPGKILWSGQQLTSANGRFRLRQQTDGNLVLLDQAKVVWHTGTGRNPGAWTQMQLDGNLVVWSPAKKPIWHAGTQGTGVTAHVQNDGNITVRTPAGKVLWARNLQVERDAQLTRGQALYGGDQRRSFNGRFVLRQQTDGNLVLLDHGKVVWQTGTGRNPGASTHMGLDGNLVVLSAAKKSIWHTGTQGPGAVTHVQNDGNITVRTPAGKVLWARR